MPTIISRKDFRGGVQYHLVAVDATHVSIVFDADTRFQAGDSITVDTSPPPRDRIGKWL